MQNFFSILTTLLFLNLKIYAQITSTITPTTATCQSNGKFTITNIAGGKAPYTAALIMGPGVPLPATYISSNVAGGGFQFIGLAGGTFKISILDDNGVEQVFTQNLATTYTLMDFIPTPSLNACNGNTYSGKVTVTGLNGGIPPYRYVIVTPSRIPAIGYQSSNVFDNLAPNTTYDVQVWDACDNYQTRQVQIPTVGAISISDPVFTKSDCSGNYKSVLSSTGGSGVITYKIVSPSFDQVGTSNTTGIFNLKSKESYTIQVSDICGNVSLQNFYVNEIIPETQAWSNGGSNCSATGGGVYIWINKGLAPYTGTITGTCGGTPFTYTLNLQPTDQGFGEYVGNLPRPCNYTYTITDACGNVITNTFEQIGVGANNLGGYNYFICPEIANNGYKVGIGASYGPPYAPTADFTFDIKNSSNVSLTGYPVTQSGSENYTTLAPGTYTATITDKCGSTNTQTIIIPNYSPPTLTVDGTNKCINAGQVNLLGVSSNVVTGTREYKIITGPDRVGEVNTTGVFSNLIGGGAYVFEFYDGCNKVTASFTIPPYDQPTFEVTFGAICAPATVSSISAFNRSKSVEPYTYEIIALNTTGGLTVPPQLDSTFSNLVIGQYNIRGVDACKNSLTVLGKIGNLEKPILNFPAQYCLGEVIKLRATQCVFGATYTWYKGATVIYTGPKHYLNIPNATLNDAGVYAVMVSVGTCSFTSDGVQVVIAPNLIIANQTSCNGSSVDLTNASVTTGSDVGTLSYWTNSAATIALANPSAVMASGTFYIKLVTAGSCTIIKPVVVSNLTFTPSATGGSVCVGDAINLTASIGSNYTWTGPLNFTSSEQNPTIVNTLTTNTGIYTVVVSNVSGCIGTATANVVVSGIPMAGADQSICSPRATASVNASTLGQSWSVFTKPLGTSPLIAANGSISGLTADGVYTFRLSQGTCFDDVQITRKVRTSAGLDISTCQTNATLVNIDINENWSFVTSPSNPSPAIVDNFSDVSGMINSGVYQFILTSQNGCTDTVQVTKIDGVNVSTQNVSVCTGGIIQLTANSTTSGATYFWQGPSGSGFTSNQQSPAIANASASNGGIYTVTATLGNCSATATAKVTFTRITVSFMAGVTNACVGQNLKVRDAATRQTGDPQVMTYFWSGPNNTNTYTSSTSEIIIPTTADRSQAGEYKLVETYDNGCVVTNTLTFSITKCQSLGDLVWKDVNNDGLNNNGELGISNVPVKLYDAANPTISIASTTTDADGKYLFRDLVPGFYIVEIDAPTGYKSSTGTNGAASGAFEPGINPSDDLSVNYDNQDHGTNGTGQLIRSGEIELSNFDEPINDGPTTKADSVYNNSSNRTIDFGIFQPAKIGDFVWFDTNKNGIQDAGELGVSGVKVNLYLGNGITPIATFTTGTDGKYLFDNLIAGTYTVEFDKTTIGSTNIFTTINDPLTTTDKDSDADLTTGKSAPITLAAGENNSTIDAGIVGNCPTTALTPTSNSPVCAGTRLELSVAGSTGATYLWTSPKGVTSNIQNLFTQNATIDDKGIWTIAIQYANGCLSSGSTTVDIKPALSGVAATATAPGCTGDNISLTASPSGAKSYEWTGIPAFTSTVQNPTISKPIADNYTFTVKITSIDGCTALATASTAIYTAPAATASSNSPVCVGSPINLSVSTSATQFAWTGPNSFTATSKTPTILKADALFAGVYTVVVTNANSCTAIATTKVVINLLLNGGDDLSICAPVSTAQLTVISGSTWQVEPSNPAPATVDATGKVSGLTVNGSYVFYITNSSGCNDTVKVFRNEKLDAGNDVVICSPTSTAKLLKLNSGQTWKYFANGQTQPIPSIDANGNVTGITQEGSYLFILEQTGIIYCADTVAVIRYSAPMAGGDQTGSGICFPQSTAKLQSANSTANQVWTVAANSFGFGKVAIDQNGNVTKMDAVGIYTFVLTQGVCTDSVKVEVNAKPNAGTDVEICSDIKTVKLANAPLNMTWSSMATNPVGTLINATTGEVTGLTTAGEYKFILKNAGGCTDTVSVKTKAIPIFDANTIQSTCTIGAANPDAKLILSGFDVANKYDYSEGTTYTGTKTFANATIIPTNGVIANNLVNPTTDKSYTVRVFNNTDCFTDKTVVLKVRACECKPDVCLPYSFRKTK